MNEKGPSDYMVCVKCITFNHAAYINDTMEGFCIQETSFPFVCVIIDDASTDGEQDVINNFLQTNFDLSNEAIAREEDKIDYILRYARHKKNLNCYFAILFLKYNHYNKKSKNPYIVEWTEHSRYMALCEGDDYWTNPHKLQMQVEEMEKNPNIGMNYTAYRYLYEASGIYRDIYTSKKIRFDNSFKWSILSLKVMIGTATVLMRNDLKKRISSEFADDYKGYKMADIQTWFHFSRLSQVTYIPIITATYRKHEGSMTAMNDAERRIPFLIDMLKVRMLLTDKYNAPNSVKRRIRFKIGSMIFSNYLKSGRYDDAFVFNQHYFKNNILIFIFLWVAKCIKLTDLKRLKWFSKRSR